jgi:hypothetical protein
VVAQPDAHVVVVVPGSQAPATVDPLDVLEPELEAVDPPEEVPDAPLDVPPDAPLADEPIEPRLLEAVALVDVSPPPDGVDVP